MRPQSTMQARWRLPVLPLVFALLATAALPVPAHAQDFLPVKAAYQVSTAVEAGRVTVRYTIADGYYLYRDRLGFETSAPGVMLGKPSLPVGLEHEDEFFGKQVIYRQTVEVGVPVTFAGPVGDFQLRVKLQGCADDGLCYPPQTWPVQVAWPQGVAAADPREMAAATAAETRVGTASDAASPASPAAAPRRKGFNLRALLGADSGARSDADFLSPDQAFVLSVTSPSRDRIRLRWDIADDYYLYRDKAKASTATASVQLGDVSIAGGETKVDEYFGEQVVFHGEMLADLPVSAAADVREVQVDVTYQGCADAGLCYPPIRKTMTVALASSTGPASGPALTAATAASAEPFRSEQDRFGDLVRNGSLLAMIGVFLVAGLGLALTPCVWPMVPILSGIIVGAGSGTPVTRGRAFSLSLAYVLGMALTYAVAGAAFALAGQQAQAFFQKPWMIVTFAALFVWLALGMFGVFTLQAPAWLQERVSQLSGQQKQGTLLGTAVVGALSSLIVTACVAPPLVGSLAVISQTGDVVRGGLALFALGVGMGAPLLLVGASAGEFLPKAGPWMDTIKQFFGILMLGVALWMLSRILPGPLALGLWAVLAFVMGYWLLMLGGKRHASGGPALVRRGIGVLAMVYGVVLLVGALAGRSDPLQPLAGFGNPTSGTASAAAEHGLAFKRIKSEQDFEFEIAAATAAGRPVMFDFYADWCVSCKEMEKYTFTDAGVQQALGKTVLLQADVTANDDLDQALMRRFGILGPPSILFFGADGAERPAYRVVGFKPAADFSAHVHEAVASGGGA